MGGKFRSSRTEGRKVRDGGDGGDGIIPVYTLCRRLMCELYDRPVVLGSVIPVILALKNNRDWRSWWAKKGR